MQMEMMFNGSEDQVKRTESSLYPARSLSLDQERPIFTLPGRSPFRKHMPHTIFRSEYHPLARQIQHKRQEKGLMPRSRDQVARASDKFEARRNHL